MMTICQEYPSSYRKQEVSAIVKSIESGTCVSVVGLSGSGKSNLLSFLVKQAGGKFDWILVDANRAGAKDPGVFFKTILQICGVSRFSEDPLDQLHDLIGRKLEVGPGVVCLVIDRFDAFSWDQLHVIAGQLRYLRDSFKYRLTFVTGTRAPVPDDTEIAELFYGHTIFLGSLNRDDSMWSVKSFAARNQVDWDEETISKIIEISGGYPSFLRGTCEAVLAGCPLTKDEIKNHPAVRRRLDEFLTVNPSKELLENCGLLNHPWISNAKANFEQPRLTAQEFKLFSFLQAHRGEICTKDALIMAVWSEDRIYEHGLRDDSLAQLIRRVREKIEVDPSSPEKIITIPGRGFIYK